MDISSYVNLSKSLMQEGLPESVITTIIKEVGKDERTKTLMDSGNSKKSYNPTIPSDNQIKFLKWKKKYKEGLTRDEASKIIKEIKENESEY